MRMLGRNAIVSSVIFGILFTLPGLLPGMSAATVQAQTPQQTLNQYVAELQKNPNDYALREKIIKHVQTMKPAPAVPEEAKRYLSRGIAAMKEAKSKDDFKDAVNEFEKAALAAPWFANAYYNLGVAQDKAGAYANAIRSLKLYLLASPDARDAEAVKGLIYEIEYRQEKAAKASSPAVIAAKKQQTYEEWLRGLDGARFFGSYNVLNEYWESELTIRGSKLYWRTSCVRGRGCIAGWFVKCRAGEMQIVERQTKCINEAAPASWNVVSDIFTISEDGKSITHAQQTTNGGTFTYYRQ
jgi:tetratricopeptide (TPR) repeat protein